MAEVEWSPAQLDRLEDALEDLELDGALERWLEDEPSPPVRERLTEYRTILQLSREAMPVEEVPAGVLDSVFAEARQAAAVAPVAAATEESFWARLRRSFMVPAVALAGTAVLVLWIGRPDKNAELAEPPPSASSTPRSPGAVPIKFYDDDEASKDAPAANGAVAPTVSPPPPVAPAGEAAPGAPPRSGAKNKQQADDDPFGDYAYPSEGDGDEEEQAAVDQDKATDGKLDKIGEAKPEPSATPKAAGPASGRWDIVSRGDRARQAGDCIAAREEYALALEDDEPGVRARAFAGIGLCDSMAGDGPSADSNFDRARQLDGGIDGFIDSQKSRRSPSTKRSSKKKRPKKKKRIDQASVDPFG